MYAYLIGTLVIATVFVLLCAVRKDLGRIMMYGGAVYLAYMSACYLLLRVLSSDPQKAINPGYWSPPSLFDLNHKMAGLGIEDVLFMFFVGGIAVGFYEIIFRTRPAKKINKHLKKGHALALGALVGAIAYVFTPIGAIYFTIIVQMVGAIVIIGQRHDLIKNALAGAFFFTFLYFTCFSIFNLMFPSFLGDYYNLDRTSHAWFLGLPLEEYLYAFTLGMMWAPIYEYMHQVKDRKNKRRSSGLRKLSPAAAATRR